MAEKAKTAGAEPGDALNSTISGADAGLADSDAAPAPQTDYWEEKVTVKLFRDDSRYTDDVFVRVHNKSFLIRRGVEVEVPRYVAEVLKQAQTQRDEAAMHSDQLQAEFLASSEKYGINL